MNAVTERQQLAYIAGQAADSPYIGSSFHDANGTSSVEDIEGMAALQTGFIPRNEHFFLQ